MPATPDELLARLDDLGIVSKTHSHQAVFTVEESKNLRGALPGGHCKSLFLKDKKGNMWLVVVLEDRAVDLKALRKQLGAKNLSFGRPELLFEILGVEPGSVTPFALINDRERRVNVVLDEAMLARDPLNYHPLSNEATTAIGPDDLLAFIADCGHQPMILDFDAEAADEAG